MTVLGVAPAGVAAAILVAFILAVLTTNISLRLLGTGRGWGKAVAAGTIGWCIGGVVALGLAGWDWGSDGLVVHTLAIAIPATMATAVGIDLLARPGSLAGAERTGLVVPPRPLGAIRQRLVVARRYRELIGLVRKHGFGPLLGAGGRAEQAAEPVGVRLRHLLEEAGGVYIKLGQIAAMRVDLLPAEVCTELSHLQNRVPVEPRERIEPVLETELGGPVSAVFAEFDWDPLAAASIGQTYRARLHSGEPVVVKVQRPDIGDVLERDLAALAHLAGVAERRTLFGRSIRSGEILGQFAESLRVELDFLHEAGAMQEMAAALGSDVRIAKVHGSYCTERVLVQERFDGFTVADTDELRDSAADRPALAEALMRSTLDQILRLGFFHADPHPGNVFVMADGTLGLIDFGAVGRLDPIQQSAVVDMMAAFIRRDISLLREGVERVAELPHELSTDRLDRAIARVLSGNLRATGTVDANALQDLVRVLTDFGIRLPGDIVLLCRALVTLDGTLGVLSPGLSIISAAIEAAGPQAVEPILDPEAMLRDELAAALPRLRRLPERVDRILTLTARGDLRIRSIVDEDGGRILRTLVNRALLAATGAAFLLASTVLLVSADRGPAVSAGTGLFEVLGYGGLVAGSVLLLRVVASVARDGTT